MQAFCGCVERLLELEIPPPRQVPADAPHGAEPDPLAPGLARHLRARPRRDLDVLVLLPRARPILDLFEMSDRAADAHPLLPGRRRLRGHPARLRARSVREFCADDADADRPVRRRCSTATRSSCTAPRNVGIVPRERLLELGVTGPLLRAAGEPWDLRKADRLPGLRRVRLQDPGGHGRRRLRPLPLPRRRDARVGARSSSRRSTACPRALASPTTASSCCRRATSSAPRWRR